MKQPTLATTIWNGKTDLQRAYDATAEAQSENKGLDEPASAAFIELLGLSAGATWREVMEELTRLKRVRAAELEQEVHRIVNGAIATDSDGCSKLWPGERQFATELGIDCGVKVLAAFVAQRKPITPAARNILERCDAMKTDQSELRKHVLDDVQKSINRQLGISDEVFIRYYH